jgi:hypothetical protein
MLNRAEVEDLQRGMNAFTNRYLYGVTPIRVDGTRGEMTDRRIRTIKYYLGYLGDRNAAANTEFRSRLWHPKSLRYSSPVRLARAAARRVKQRREAKANEAKGRRTGVGTYDGHPCANWMIPYLDWARHTGHDGNKWRGQLVSGWRDPAYSESLCYRMCGHPSCPGMCAGRSSNHSGSVKPAGAVDVTDYDRFRWLMQYCPTLPHLTNHLPRDRVHFSVSGG